MTRSTRVGIPSLRVLPLSFGISTLRTGMGLYFPFKMEFLSSSLWSFKYGSKSFASIESTPPLPPFDTTFLYARFIL